MSVAEPVLLPAAVSGAFTCLQNMNGMQSSVVKAAARDSMLIRTVVASLLVVAGSIFASDTEAKDFQVRMENCEGERAFAAVARTRMTSDVGRTFHDILMINELNSGCGALQFTDADMDSHENGFSFGLSQFDLATRPASRAFLKDILQCAVAEYGPLFSQKELEFLEVHLGKSTWVLKQDAAAWATLLGMRERIERALGSSCGRQKLTNAYLQEMAGFEVEAGRVWAAVTKNNPKMKDAEGFFRLYALDLRNVLGPPDGFRNVVTGGAAYTCWTLCQRQLVPRYVLAGPVTVTDFIRYPLQATCYGYVPTGKRQHDTLRRLNTVLKSVDLARLPLTEKDRQYLTGEFADTLATIKSLFPNAEDTNLRALVTVSNGGAPVAGTARPLDAKKLELAQAACTKT